LRDAVQAYIDAGRTTRAKRTTIGYERFLRSLGGVGELAAPPQRVELRRLLAAIAAQTPTHANRVWALIRAALRFAVDEGLIESTGVDGMKRPGGRELPRDRVLSEREVGLLMNGAQGRERAFLLIALLTGQRTGEVLRMRAEDVDGRERLWRIPAAARKDRRPHVLPLVESVLQLVEGKRGLVLGGLSANPGRLKAAIDDRVPEVRDWRLYDLRRSAATHIAGLGASPDVVERILGHSLKGVAGIYNRHRYEAEMREALTRWEARLREWTAGCF
jgi:integrase